MNTPLSDTAERAEEAYELDADLVSEVIAVVEERDAATLHALIDPMHPADVADLLEQVKGDVRRALLALLDVEMDGEVLSELDENLREEVIDQLDPEVLAEAVRELDSDDVVDLVEDLDEPQQEAILGALPAADRAAVEQSLSFPEGSAGRLMQREVVVAPEHWSVGQAIDFMRAKDDLPADFYHVVLVDPRMRPVGYVTLGRIMGSRRNVDLSDLTEESFRTIPADQPEEDVAYAFNQYHLISAPVVDGDGRLIGMITIDDAMIVLDEEHEEDILRLAGVGEGSLSDSIVDTMRARVPWLFVNLLTAILASVVISFFDAQIAQLVALAVLMPIVASMGGNAGTQTLTVAVRALATRDLTDANIWRVVRREGAVGTINGLIFAVIMGFVGAFWFDMPMLGVVIALAMVVNLVVAGLSGVMVPIGMTRLGIDPALASGTFVTTVTDVAGFLAFLGLATIMLL
ncbi:MAG: magnesium transporter [Pseudomonadota bacterium]